MNNRFQGDPMIAITPDGATMKFISGQPIMDGGFSNAVIISLHTRKNWWGNILFDTESEKIGSDFEKTCLEPIVSLSSINNITDAAEKALKWMKNDSIASDINITVTNPKADNIRTEIIITPPGQDAEKLLFIKNGINWIGQVNNPDYKKVLNGI